MSGRCSSPNAGLGLHCRNDVGTNSAASQNLTHAHDMRTDNMVGPLRAVFAGALVTMVIVTVSACQVESCAGGCAEPNEEHARSLPTGSQTP